MSPQQPLREGEQTGTISREIVRMTAESTGRGPTSVRTSIDQDLICVVLQDNLGKGERLLLACGEEALVTELRHAYHRAMRPALLQIVEAVTGREVRTVLFDHSCEPDVSSISFVLTPQLAPVLAMRDQEPVPSADRRAPTHQPHSAENAPQPLQCNWRAAPNTAPLTQVGAEDRG